MILPLLLAAEFQAAVLEGSKAVDKTLHLPLRQFVKGNGAIGHAAAAGTVGIAEGNGAACGKGGDVLAVDVRLFGLHGCTGARTQYGCCGCGERTQTEGADDFFVHGFSSLVFLEADWVVRTLYPMVFQPKAGCGGLLHMRRT